MVPICIYTYTTYGKPHQSRRLLVTTWVTSIGIHYLYSILVQHTAVYLAVIQLTVVHLPSRSTLEILLYTARHFSMVWCRIVKAWLQLTSARKLERLLINRMVVRAKVTLNSCN